MYSIFVDSGINTEFKEFKEKKIINFNKSIVKDLTGHGTSCISCYTKFSDNEKLGIIKIFNENNYCDVNSFYNALKKCLYIDNINGICLSLRLDISDYYMKKKFTRLIEKILQKKIKIVTPIPNDYDRDNFLLTIDGIYKTKFKYSNKLNIRRIGENTYVFEDAYRLYPTTDGEYKFFWGNSISSPAILAYLENKNCISLKSKSKVSEFSSKELNEIYYKYFINNNKKKIYKNAFSFIKEIENRFKLDLSYNEFTLEDFMTFQSIVKRLEWLRRQNEFAKNK